MARDPYSRVVGGETASWEKLQAAMRHAIEACTEIGVRRQDERWAKLGIVFEKLLAQCTALYAKAKLDAVVGHRH